VKEIENELKELIDGLRKNLPDVLKGVILYGSWAKGNPEKYSDIDVIALFSELDDEKIRKIREIISKIHTPRHLDFVYAKVEDFEREKIPLYTAIKKEGKIVFGECNMEISPVEPRIKYKDFFLRSKEFESHKIKMVEEIKKKHSYYGGIELCYVASKHAIQACLAMKGEGYSSKFKVLLPLCEKHFGSRIAEAFRKLFDIYVKSEYTHEIPTEEESDLALCLAKEVIRVYDMVEKEMGI
jgi:predicted nucleotidyltransferase